MSAVALTLTAIMTLLLSQVGFAAGGQTTNDADQTEEDIKVIDIVIVSTNQVTIGTNTMSWATATNVIARYRDTVDVIAVHGSTEGNDFATRKSPVMTEIAHAGVPLVFVERDGEYLLREHSGVDGIRTVKIGTEQFAALRRFWRSGKEGAKTSSGPVWQATVDLDTATGTYELKRVEFSLFGDHVWLMHEQRTSDDRPGSVGIQFKKEW